MLTDRRRAEVEVSPRLLELYRGHVREWTAQETVAAAKTDEEEENRPSDSTRRVPCLRDRVPRAVPQNRPGKCQEILLKVAADREVAGAGGSF